MVDIKGLFYHIFIVIAVVIISIPIWNNAPSKAGANIAASFKDMQVMLDFEGFDRLTTINDSSYQDLEPKDITLRNATKNNKNYNLAYVYSKTSTVPYKDIMLSLDNQVYALSDIKYTEDNDYYYFILDSDTIDAYTTKDVEARIWTTATTGSLTGSFIVM